MLGSGDHVPDLDLILARRGPVRFSDFFGNWLVLYFYPKDSTPGCTTQGLTFNALLADFRALGGEVLGVSRDSIKSHQNFCAKQGFGFDLISDSNEHLCRAFGVIKEKSMYGRKVSGIERSTFLIDPKGRIVAAWRAVRVAGHADAVLAALRQIQRLP